jgi:hypothetical protein
MVLKKMPVTKSIAALACFSALYSVLSSLPISPLVGLPGKAVTAAAILAPIIGIVLGPYLGAAATTMGGLIGLFANLSFSPPSLVSGIATAYCAGLLFEGKRAACTFAYFSLLFIFAFYPFIGPVWTYPFLLWFQIIGFILLISPLQSAASNYLKSGATSKLAFAVFAIALTSTLAGQIAGSLASEALAWPAFLADINAWRGIWQVVAVLYPVERIIIALVATLIATSLIRALRPFNVTAFVKTSVDSERHS